MPGTQDIRQISAADLAALGMHHVAFLKRQVIRDRVYWGIFAADGTEMARMGDVNLARAACLQHDLEPLSLH